MKITGIEITQEGIAAATLERQGSTLRVVGLTRLLRGDVEEGGSDADDASLLAALAEKIPLRGMKCCLVTSANTVTTRSVRFGFSDARAIARALPGAIEEQLPMPIEGMRFAWEKRPLANSTPGRGNILAYAYDGMALVGLRTEARKAGIELRIIAPPLIPFATVQARTIQGRFVALSLTEAALSFSVVSDGKVLAMRHVARDGELTQTDLNREIWQTLAGISEEEGGLNLPERIVVSGTMPSLSSVNTPLGEIPLEPASIRSATGVVVEEELKNAWEDGPFDTPVAVAASAFFGWRHLTLWEQGFAPVEFMSKYKKQAIATAALLVMTVLLFGVRTGFSIRESARATKAVEAQMAKLYVDTFRDVRRAPSAEVMAQSMAGRLRQARDGAAYNGGRKERVRVLDLLNAISTTIPKELKVDLKRLSLTRGKLTVNGLADDFAVIDTMKRALEKSPMISGVTIASSSKEPGGERFQFKVVIALSGGEAS